MTTSTYRAIGPGDPCPICDQTMERRERAQPPPAEGEYLDRWDYCRSCDYGMPIGGWNDAGDRKYVKIMRRDRLRVVRT